MQEPGGPWEDQTKGLKSGDGVMPYLDQESGEEIDDVFKEVPPPGRPQDLRIFAAYWPYYDKDAPPGGIAKLFKDIKKHVVSRSGDVDTSGRGSVLLRDIADVKRLQEKRDRTSLPRAAGNWCTRSSRTTSSTR